ncbi:MAG TPA: hypothetical protein ENH91_04065 [Leeuwenhoekiella sp.]|nr:hypothetical protein [Leeuwenhoekiella sp.]
MNIITKNCRERDRWVQKLIPVLEELQHTYTELSSVHFYGGDIHNAVPIRYLQPERELVIFKREGITANSYREMMKVFCFYSDAYYVTHNNYATLIKQVGRLQTISLQSSSFKYVNLLSDLMDTFIVCMLSGKYMNSFKRFDADTEILRILEAPINTAYSQFDSNPFYSLSAAYAKSMLEHFCKVPLNIQLPSYQSAQIILPKAEELLKLAVTSVGERASYSVTELFYHTASVFIDSTIHNAQKITH